MVTASEQKHHLDGMKAGYAVWVNVFDSMLSDVLDKGWSLVMEMEKSLGELWYIVTAEKKDRAGELTGRIRVAELAPLKALHRLFTVMEEIEGDG